MVCKFIPCMLFYVSLLVAVENICTAIILTLPPE